MPTIRQTFNHMNCLIIHQTLGKTIHLHLQIPYTNKCDHWQQCVFQNYIRENLPIIIALTPTGAWDPTTRQKCWIRCSWSYNLKLQSFFQAAIQKKMSPGRWDYFLRRINVNILYLYCIEQPSFTPPANIPV